MFGGVRFICNQLLAVARVCCIFLVALFLPKFFLVHLHSAGRPMVTQQQRLFRLGLENLSENFLRSLTPKNDFSYTVGLVTNQSGKDYAGRTTVDVLLDHGVQVVKLFAPEHGMKGIVAAGCPLLIR